MSEDSRVVLAHEAMQHRVVRPARNVRGGGDTHAAVGAVCVLGGDALLVWSALTSANDFTMYSEALGTDGPPRGPATLIADHLEASR